MEVNPIRVELDPVLPYKWVEKMIEVKNPMEQDLELYSIDFDKKFIEEEDILKRIDCLNLPVPEVIYLPLREPGGEFWQSIRA